MLKYLFLGDTHGEFTTTKRAIQMAADHKATILQNGDWGFLWPKYDGVEELIEVLDKYSVNMRFIDGNHDDHLRLRTFKDGILSPNLIYQPRASTYTDSDGTNFLFMGGAPSIDKEGRTPGLSWWPEEEITETEYYKAMDVDLKPIHVLVTHDAPKLPPGFSSDAGTEAFQRSAKRSTGMIENLMLKHKPGLLCHGHYHSRYTSQIGSTKVEGLASNMQRLDQCTMLWSRS